MPERKTFTEEQVLVWAPWRPDPKHFLKGRFGLVAVPGRAGRRPDRVWTLFDATDEARRPTLPFEPSHGLNAILEDYVHDWNWVGDTLKFYTRAMNQSCWLLLEYFGEEEVVAVVN